jgi:excisionase family DNA binding protein
MRRPRSAVTESETARLLTTREVADRYRVAPETILRWIEIRGLPAIRLTSRAIRYDEDALDAWERGRSSTGEGE